MIHDILIWPDPLLYRQSLGVDVQRLDDYQQLLHDMIDTMYAAHGIGLAAIQIGVPLRLVVMDVGFGPEVYINPHIDHYLGVRRHVREGCLSVPGILEEVQRYPGVAAVYVDARGQPREYVSDLAVANVDQMLPGNRAQHEVRSQCLQHELEHLDGHNFVEHLPAMTRGKIRKLMRRKQ